MNLAAPYEVTSPPPSERHFHAFTWTNCFAQKEGGSRVYRFGIIGTQELRHFRIYFRRITWPKGVWMTHDMSRSRSLELSSCLKTISIPLYFKADWESTAHNDNSLIVPRDGASLTLWWDSMCNPVFQALEPIWPFLSETREILNELFVQQDRLVDDAER